MRILDEADNEIFDPDYSLGYTVEETITVGYAEATGPTEGIWHYEIVCVYPNGGKDVERVVDVPGEPYIPAHDIKVTILRWYEY